MFKSCKLNDKIIFIDIDDSICDTRRAVYDIYQEISGDKSSDIMIPSKRYKDFCPKWEDEQINNLFKTSKEVYNTAKPVKGAVEGVEKLLKLGFDVRLVSLNFSSSVHYKQEWVDKYFPSLSDKLYIGTNVRANKDIFKGFAIIDDDMKNIETSPCEYPILIDIYNIYKDSPYQHKYSSWKELVDKF